MSQIAHFSISQGIINCLSCCFHYSDGLLFLFNNLFDTMLKTVDFIVYCLYFIFFIKLFVLKKYGFFNFVFNNLRFFVESQVEIGFTNRNIFTICNFIRRLYTVFFGRILRFPQCFGSLRQPFGKKKSRKTAISFCTFLPEESLYQSFQHFQHMLC